VGKPLEKWQHGRQRRKFEYNIKMDLREGDMMMKGACNRLVTVLKDDIWC
jgi:hypothetical protein